MTKAHFILHVPRAKDYGPDGGKINSQLFRAGHKKTPHPFLMRGRHAAIKSESLGSLGRCGHGWRDGRYRRGSGHVNRRSGCDGDRHGVTPDHDHDHDHDRDHDRDRDPDPDPDRDHDPDRDRDPDRDPDPDRDHDHDHDHDPDPDPDHDHDPDRSKPSRSIA
jgi:hypothetical protein